MDLHSKQLIEAGRRLDARSLVAGTEGNISLRLPRGDLLISGSGTMLGALETSMLVHVSADGRHYDSDEFHPTSELAAHLAAYRVRPEVNAVVHAHPPHAITLMMRGESLEAVPLGEAAYAFGSVPTTEFAVPGTPEGGEVAARWIGERDAILLDRHGALTVGRTMAEALSRMEMLDAVARVILLAGGSGALKPLTSGEADRIAEAALKAGALEAAVRAWRQRVPVAG